MFCSNCGNQLPEGTRFCSACGAQQPTNSDVKPTPATTESQPAKKAPKKVNILVTIAIVLCAFLLGKFVIAPSMLSDSNQGTQPNDQGNQTQQSANNNESPSAGTANLAYEAVFDGTYIVHFQTFFNMEMASFASKQDNGIIYCADYGYKNDVVKQWVETMYIPVSEYTDTEKAEVESTMKSQFASLEALSCCTVNYKMSTNYFTITFTYADVDKAENYSELYNANILQTNTFISMSATEKSLLSQGFVKK